MAVTGISWTAGSTRARLLAGRALGRDGARRLAGSPTLADALDALTDTPYGHDVAGGMGLAGAQRGVAATALWQTRVLAGWLPPTGGEMLRDLAGWWELQNIEDHAATLEGASPGEPFDLGALASSWPRVAATRTREELRRALAASVWGAPAGEGFPALGVSLRLSWARRVAARVPSASAWVAPWAVLVVARDLFAGARALPAAGVAHVPDLGISWRADDDLAAFARRLPPEQRWVLDSVGEAAHLWRAEARWWGVVDAEARGVLRRVSPGPQVPVAAVAVLGVDAWRVQAALELATRGGEPVEAFDAVA